MIATRVLLVEDDKNIVDLVRSNLVMRGFEIATSATGSDAVDLLESWEPAIILLDLTLPDNDGFELCRRIREQSAVGIIVVSARTSEPDKVRALNLGADDYLTKPFGVDELLARMMATLRRSRESDSADKSPTITEIRLGDVVIDLKAKAVHKDGVRIRLTPTEFSLLRHLALNEGTLLSYSTLLRAVWGLGYENSREYVRVYVGRLRSKLEDPEGPPMIITEPRAGYRLVRPQ